MYTYLYTYVLYIYFIYTYTILQICYCMLEHWLNQCIIARAITWITQSSCIVLYIHIATACTVDEHLLRILMRSR